MISCEEHLTKHYINVFEEYLNSEDLEKRERAKLWRASIGLQTVDNLRVSNFLIETARSISKEKFQ